MAILDATEEVMSEAGVEAFSLNAVAARAGIAVGTIYNHFRDRDELIRQLFLTRRAQMFAEVDSVLKEAQKLPFRDKLTAFVRVVLQHFDNRHDFLSIVLQTEHLGLQCLDRIKSSDSPERSAMLRIQEQAAEIVKAGLKEKVLRLESADLYPALLMGVVRAILLDRIDARARPVAEEAERVVDLFLRGAGAGPRTRTRT
ncbi:TetR/AcrR family transcriptional regulator [Pendulispora albinea]|uniref:TetR/AcrR family transcriptional regulator n=1 Tax=Pendulispora albinea TaxID=2741071 RepID=A0ABZ2LPW6_9BACT